VNRAHESRLDKSIIVPFIIFTLVWGSTWLVIRGQIDTVAPQWSVTYRFAMAAVAMAAVAHWKGQSLRPNPQLLFAATIVGVSQFCINFASVYVAERYITSGVVATVFALLLIPNSLLAWAMLGQRPNARFAFGGAIAAGGIGLLFLHEMRVSAATNHQVLVGLGFTLLGLLGASFANVYQARKSAQRHPLLALLALLAWGMAIGAVVDALLAVAVAGPPTIDWSLGYWLGLTYLALAASVLCFSLYFPVVRKIGPGRAAYSSVMVPVIAMGLSTIFENYQWSLLAGAGGLLALGGMLVALSGNRGSKIAAPDAG